MKPNELCGIFIHEICKKGDMSRLHIISKYLTRAYVTSHNNYAFGTACQFNQLHVVKWLVATFQLTVMDVTSDNNYGLRYANYEIVKWLTDTYKLTNPNAQQLNAVVPKTIVPASNVVKPETIMRASSVVAPNVIVRNTVIVPNVIVPNVIVPNVIVPNVIVRNTVMHQTLTCTICFELFEQPVTLTSCGHTFCNTCVTDWVKVNKSCPICRQPCNINNFVPSFIIKEMVNALV